MTLIFTSIPLFLLFGSVSSDCSLYGVCHETTAYFNYCPSSNATRTPRPLPSEDEHLQSQLMSKCPYLFADGNKALCCDSRQVEALFKMISVANSLFSRCSSCMDNFYKYWCMYTCSPKQADFLKVLETETSPTTNRSMAVKVQYDLSRQYAEATFDSCKDVKLSSSSGTVMLIMCGRLRANETCTLERWLNFMGTRSHGLGVPVDIVHKFHEKTSSAAFMHINTTRCDQAPRPGQSRCLPTDCPNSPVSQQFHLEQTISQETCRLFGLGCSMYFLLFSVFVLIVVLAWAVFPNCHRQQQTAEDSIDQQAHWIPNQIEINTSLYGEFVFRQSYLTLLSGLLLVIGCCTGLLFLTVISDPVEVWVPPNSRAIEEKEFFDSHFGPFYRVQQIIFYSKPGRIQPVSENIGPVFQKSFLLEVFHVLNSIRRLSPTLSDGRRVSFEDICFRPMGSGYDCLINSPTNYFQHESSMLDDEIEEKSEKGADDPFDYDEESEPTKRTFLDHLGDCFRNPYTLQTSLNKSCLAPWGGPTFPFLVFGGGEGSDPMNATAVIISIPLSSKADVIKMKTWEKSFIIFLKKYSHEDVELSFMAERSIQDEIKRSSEADAVTVVYAAILMIAYMIIALGGYRNKLSLISTKILIGFCGVLSIFAAILSSLGLLSFYGLRLPSASIVVHCFVVLVIGSHRVFSVVSRLDPLLPSSLGFALPSALVCSIVQSVVFIIGAFIPVPAVRCFCLLSSLSVVLQFAFLCVLFLPICVLHSKREQKFREVSSICQSSEDFEQDKEIEETLLKRLSLLLFRPCSAVFVLVLSVAILVISPFYISKIQLGLDQKLAVPKDSYMYAHFVDMERFLNVGPPVYFVVQGDIDFSKRALQNKFCSLGGCEDNSVGGILSQAVANPSKSYLTGEVLNWLDTYMEWLTPENQCCRVFDRKDSAAYCTSITPANGSKCVSCDSFNSDGRPTESIFYRHLGRFTEDVPGPQCVKGGKAAFHDAIHLDPSGHVDASHLMTFHVALRNSSAYIAAMNKARLVASKIEDALGGGIRVFPYSVFYIFYEQFTTIRTVSAYQLVFAFSTIFLTVFLLIGFDALKAFCLLSVCCFQLILQAIGMAMWTVDLNSISAVNLVVGVTVTIEYSLPILLALTSHTESSATVVASDSLSGLTSPLLLGTSLFAFAQSPFFNVYFFRMLTVSALSGLFSSLILLPSLISLSSLFKRNRQRARFQPIPSGSSALSQLNTGNDQQVSRPPFLSTVL